MLTNQVPAMWLLTSLILHASLWSLATGHGAGILGNGQQNNTMEDTSH